MILFCPKATVLVLQLSLDKGVFRKFFHNDKPICTPEMLMRQF